MREVSIRSRATLHGSKVWVSGGPFQFALSAPFAEEGEPMRELLHEPTVTYHERLAR
jgi:hypothetical protein